MRQSKPRKPEPMKEKKSAKEPATTTAGAAAQVQKPHAVIARRAADRARAGHLWVYASDVVDVVAQKETPPNLLAVVDGRELLLGTALYSPNSQIMLRIVSREAINEAEWLALFEERLRAAIRRRKELSEGEGDAVRLCFSEADGLPGLIVDKYNDLVIVQLLARGLDNAAIRGVVVKTLREEIAPETIIERPDARIRELEGLSTPPGGPLYARNRKAPKLETRFTINGLVFEYDANAGQKTGAFLDQRMNYQAASEWTVKLGATGRALDICTYQGGFALHMARVAGEVIGVDASRASLEVAEKNLTANAGVLKGKVEWLEADAFELLREWSKSGEKFDAIVLDPPAFAKSKRAVEGALRGYKELNLRALELLNPGGLLVTCSCSHHITWADLEGALASAGADAKRRVQMLERRGAALDHPVVLAMPESEYLKAIYCKVD